MNIKTPNQVTAQDRSSFAYKTIKDRLPEILVKIIDFFHRQRSELHKYGVGLLAVPNEAELKEIEVDAKEVISRLAKLRKDLETNKPLELLELIPSLGSEFEYFNDDIEEWNKSLIANKLGDGSMPRWFESSWLLVECYMYRKVKEALLRTKHLKMYDPFVESKQSACRASLSQMTTIAAHLKTVEKLIDEAGRFKNERSEFSLFFQLALWANKSDLSLGGNDANNVKCEKLATDIKETLDSLQENVLCDNQSEAWFKIQAIKSQLVDRSKSTSTDETLVYVDLVADNSGYEIFVDLCLAHFLTLLLFPDGRKPDSKPLLKIRFHVKRMPWFVSDTMRHDIEWLTQYLSTQVQEPSLQSLGHEWKSYFDSGFWQIHDHKFWTLGCEFSQMQTIAPDLYSTLSASSFIIFKGDLNYRKLTGDRDWHILTPFKVALRGFQPAPMVALRTCKADVVVGIEDVNIFARINNNELPRDWRISGNFGLIQYLDSD